MSTINISLPSQLKAQADQLIEDGHFVSFSDLVRTALRQMMEENHLNSLLATAKKDLKSGKAYVLADKDDIDKYVDEITKT